MAELGLEFLGVCGHPVWLFSAQTQWCCWDFQSSRSLQVLHLLWCAVIEGYMQVFYKCTLRSGHGRIPVRELGAGIYYRMQKQGNWNQESEQLSIDHCWFGNLQCFLADSATCVPHPNNCLFLASSHSCLLELCPLNALCFLSISCDHLLCAFPILCNVIIYQKYNRCFQVGNLEKGLKGVKGGRVDFLELLFEWPLLSDQMWFCVCIICFLIWSNIPEPSLKTWHPWCFNMAETPKGYSSIFYCILCGNRSGFLEEINGVISGIKVFIFLIWILIFYVKSGLHFSVSVCDFKVLILLTFCWTDG